MSQNNKIELTFPKGFKKGDRVRYVGPSCKEFLHNELYYIEDVDAYGMMLIRSDLPYRNWFVDRNFELEDSSSTIKDSTPILKPIPTTLGELISLRHNEDKQKQQIQDGTKCNTCGTPPRKAWGDFRETVEILWCDTCKDEVKK